MAAKAKTTQLPASLAGIDVSGDDLIRSIVEIVLNEMLEVQFSEQLGAAPYERSPERLGYRAELLLVGRDAPSSTRSRARMHTHCGPGREARTAALYRSNGSRSREDHL